MESFIVLPGSVYLQVFVHNCDKLIIYIYLIIIRHSSIHELKSFIENFQRSNMIHLYN